MVASPGRRLLAAAVVTAHRHLDKGQTRRVKAAFVCRVTTIPGVGVAWSQLFSQKESESDSGFGSTI